MVRYLVLCLTLITLSPELIYGSQLSVSKTAIKGSGLPIPRFVMTKANRVNLRVGPGNHYPTRAVYIRKHIPLMIVAEFDFWRKVKDMDGQEGWIHKSLLSNTKLIWIRASTAAMLADPSCPEDIVLKAERGVEGEYLNQAKGRYVKISIAGHKGWMRIDDIWGIIGSPDR